jgi:hypothetical protein
VEEAAPGDGLEVRLTDGVLDCRVTERRKL